MPHRKIGQKVRSAVALLIELSCTLRYPQLTRQPQPHVSCPRLFTFVGASRVLRILPCVVVYGKFQMIFDCTIACLRACADGQGSRGFGGRRPRARGGASSSRCWATTNTGSSRSRCAHANTLAPPPPSARLPISRCWKLFTMPAWVPCQAVHADAAAGTTFSTPPLFMFLTIRQNLTTCRGVGRLQVAQERTSCLVFVYVGADRFAVRVPPFSQVLQCPRCRPILSLRVLARSCAARGAPSFSVATVAWPALPDCSLIQTRAWIATC